MKVQIYATECCANNALEENVKKVVEELNIDVKIIKITEMDKILGAGIISPPGFAVEGDIKSMGRLPSVDEIKKWIKEKT